MTTIKKRFTAAMIIAPLFLLLAASEVAAFEFAGKAALEARLFSNPPLYAGQAKQNVSILGQPEFYHEFKNGSSVIFTPFARLDSSDEKRTHFDIRELNYFWIGNDWEFRAGLGKVFWGTTEFVHLVDIINQTDLVEGIDGEDKLGQPMAHLSLIQDWGVVDFFVLPGFREQTFPGRKGRLRYSLSVDTDNPTYESSSKERHVDFALRYSHTVGDWDFGIYHFAGTSREPLLSVGVKNGVFVLLPYYQQINQTGLDAQVLVGDWTVKLEALRQESKSGTHHAFVGGFEYTLPGGLGDTGWDLGLIAEYAYDTRQKQATTLNENDLMMGARLAMNDADGTELLAGAIRDLDTQSMAFSLEASRRITDNIKATLESSFFLNSPPSEGLYQIRRDNYLSLEIAYYF